MGDRLAPAEIKRRYAELEKELRAVRRDLEGHCGQIRVADEAQDWQRLEHLRGQAYPLARREEQIGEEMRELVAAAKRAWEG